MIDICEFVQRTNIHHFKYRSVNILLYDDHRTLFPIIFDLIKNRFLSEIPNLFYFDYHDDCIVSEKVYVKDRLKILNTKEIDKVESRDVWNYAEYELSKIDDDWLTALMDLNLIKNAVLIGGKMIDNVTKLNSRYEASADKHYLYKLEHLYDAISNRGSLGDSVSDRIREELRRLFKYNVPADKTTDSRQYILDFDLDCFTTDCCGQRAAWPESIFYERYVDNYNVRSLLDRLISDAAVVTICREPECCGGLGESNKILTYLDKYFFEGVLKTQPLF